MGEIALVDAGFIVALISLRDANHRWASEQAPRYPPPWQTCEAVLSEAFHLLGKAGRPSLSQFLHRRAITPAFDLARNIEPVTKLMQKYQDVPMSFADACLVRMTELIAESVVLTTDSDFRVYRRHGRQVLRCTMPA